MKAPANHRWAGCFGAACLTVTLIACTDQPETEPLTITPEHSTGVSERIPPSNSAATAIQPRGAPDGGHADPAPATVAPRYSFVGKWTEGSRTVVYLKRGEQPVAVSVPGRLDEQYEVQFIDDRRIVLRYLPLGTFETIDLDAPASLRRNSGSTATRTVSPALPTAAGSDEQAPDN